MVTVVPPYSLIPPERAEAAARSYRSRTGTAGKLMFVWHRRLDSACQVCVCKWMVYGDLTGKRSSSVEEARDLQVRGWCEKKMGGRVCACHQYPAAPCSAVWGAGSGEETRLGRTPLSPPPLRPQDLSANLNCSESSVHLRTLQLAPGWVNDK